jgi:small Trp-rich protein
LAFFLAGAWWSWSDATGLTKRREMKRQQDKTEARQRKITEALGAAGMNGVAQAKSTRKPGHK